MTLTCCCFIIFIAVTDGVIIVKGFIVRRDNRNDDLLTLYYLFNIRGSVCLRKGLIVLHKFFMYLLRIYFR